MIFEDADKESELAVKAWRGPEAKIYYVGTATRLKM
jgi:hypothetical protein